MHLENQSSGIERFSDRKSGKAKSKALLSDFIRMEPDYIPAELAKGLCFLVALGILHLAGIL